MIHVYNKTHSKLSTIVVAFNAGSRMEGFKGFNPGIAHMLEHCIFKGTKKRNFLEIQREIAFLGGFVNAFTSHEIVAYHITVPFENLEESIEILSDIVFSSTFPEEEFLKEKEVVKEEEISRLDDPMAYIWKEFSSRFFNNYIGTPVIGTQETIDSFTRDEVEDFYNVYCRKENAIVSLCSNLSKKDAKALMTKYFGRQNGKIKRSFNHKESEYRDSSTVEVFRPGIEHTYVWIGTPGLVTGTEYDPAARILLAILGSGMDSRLFTEAREKRGLAYSISAGMSDWEFGGLTLIDSSVREANLEELLGVIEAEVDKVRTEHVTEEELQRAKNKLRASSYHLIEDGYGTAMRGMREKLHRMPSLEEYMSAVEKTTVEDIMSVANMLFDSSKKMTLICRAEA